MISNTFKRVATKTATLGLAAMVLASCYLPSRFDAEIEVDRAGYYSMIFDGYMADVYLFDGLRKGKISRAEEKEKIAVIERDFSRDANTQEFQYYREGHFRVKWERKGDLLKAKTVTFLRRNELILQLKYVANSGYVVLEGKSIKQENRKRIYDMGLNMQGTIRVKTDMPIKSHNATIEKKDPKDPRYKWLSWDIESIMSPRPRAVFIIE
ncbi:hypothetical protein V5T82_02630 [Magnetovibrio sp. PR-2]|uniref:hypothetical protein n=1 Tax=Magnetovibrio sp. PR-2 TaxID=3120356 RepID=UPI002FCE2EF3